MTPTSSIPSPEARRGTNAALGGGGFHHVAVKARDFDATVRFHQEVLGLRPKITWLMGNGRRAAMLDTGDGNYLEVFEDPDYRAAADGAILHLALRVRDVDAVTARARAAGAKVTVEPKDVSIPSTPPTPVRLAFIEAPDGVIIEFFANDVT